MHFIFFQYLKNCGVPDPVRELKFYPGRKWSFDFAWPQYKVALEVEGGIYGVGKPCPVCKRKPVGAHTSIERLLSDMEKYNAAASTGWSVLRVTPQILNKLETIKLIQTTIQNKKHG